MFYNFSLKIGTTQCMSSIKTCIPPGIHITKRVCGHIDIIYIFPWSYVSFYGVGP